MKKKTSSTAEAPVEEKAPRKHGPDREKVQITIRIQKELMDQAYALMKQTNMRITDMLERGLILAMKEEDQELPLLTSQVRFVVANATRLEQEELREFLIYLRADEVRKPSETDMAIRKFIREYLKSFLPYRKEVMDLYSRYGRTEKEIEKLTG